VNWVERHPVISILICSAVIFLFHLNVLPVTIMEARNFITAREMITDGNWLLTTMNDLPRYQKPPLPSWLSAVFGGLFGIENVASLRLPTMLTAVLGSVILYVFSLKIIADKRLALINALVLTTSFYFMAIVNEAPWDIYTHVFMLISIYYLFSAFTTEKSVWKHWLLAALFFGLSFMGKGPISFYALLLPFIIAYGIFYRFQNFKRKIAPTVVFLIVGFVIGLWWFVYVRIADPNAFLAIAKKETGNWSSYNVRPFYYYWSFFTQSGIWTILAFTGLAYPYLKNKVCDKKAYLFTFLWTVIAVVLLSIIPEKKSRYLMPVLIPLALNTGFYIDYVIRAFSTTMKKSEKIPIYVHFVVIAGIGMLFPIGGYIFLKDDLSEYLMYFISASVVLASISIAILYYLKKQQIFTLFLLNVLFVMGVKLLVFPLSKALEKNPEYQIVSQDSESPVFSYGELAPEVIWHYGAALPEIDENNVSKRLKEFRIMVSQNSDADFKRIFEKDHHVEQITHFDLNTNVGPDEKGYKKRLVGNLYLVNRR